MQRGYNFVFLTWLVIIFAIVFLTKSSQAVEHLDEQSLFSPEHLETPINQEHHNLYEIEENPQPSVELNFLPPDNSEGKITPSIANPLLAYQASEEFSRYVDTTLAIVPVGLLALDIVLPSGGLLLNPLSWLRNTLIFGAISSGISSTVRWLNWAWCSKPNHKEIPTNSESLFFPKRPLNLQELDIVSNTSFLSCYLIPITIASYKISMPLFTGMVIISSLFTCWTSYMIKGSNSNAKSHFSRR
jgi:hypothetical protein